MQYLEDKARNIHTIARYLGVNKRTVYRYIKLYEALGYITIKDKNDKIRILKTY
jgi:predicted DNA-binding transcriptional regulator YafY